jgi:hypothetical protein
MFSKSTRSSVRPDSSPPAHLCFAHSHMSCAEYGLYSHLREVSSRQDYLYRFDDRTIAGRFALERGTSKSSINALRQSLVRKGFIVWQEPQKRVGGRFAPRLGRILSHKEWAERYPGKCHSKTVEADFTCPEKSDSPVQSSPATCPENSTHQSGLELSPVQKEAIHQSGRQDISIHTLNSINTNQSLGGMAATASLVQPPHLSEAIASFQPEGHLHAPVPQTGQVESETNCETLPKSVGLIVQSSSQSLMDAVINIAATLGMSGEVLIAPWRTVVERIVAQGHDPSLVPEVVRYYVVGYGVQHVRQEGAEGFAKSFRWLLDDLTEKQAADLKAMPVDMNLDLEVSA